MKVRIKLSQWSTLCMLLAMVLDNFTPSEPPLAETLFMLLLLILPGIGAVLGVMSYRREARSGWIIFVIVINLILLLLRLIIILSEG